MNTLPPGDGLLSTGEGESYARVRVDYLDKASWEAFCASLPAVAQVDADADPQDGAVDVQAAPQDAPQADVGPVLPAGRAWVTIDGTTGHSDALLVVAHAAIGAHETRAILAGKLAGKLPGAAALAGLNPADYAGYTRESLGAAMGNLGVDTRKRSLRTDGYPTGQQRWITDIDVVSRCRRIAIST